MHRRPRNSIAFIFKFVVAVARMSRPVNDELHLVRPRLYVSSWNGANRPDDLAAAGITHVLMVGHFYVVPEDEPACMHDPRFVFRQIDAEDEDMFDIYEKCFEGATAFIDEAMDASEAGAVLVHCYVGVSRSVACAAAWMMLDDVRAGRVKQTEVDAKAVCAEIRAARPCAQPNNGFVEQLCMLARMIGDYGIERDILFC